MSRTESLIEVILRRSWSDYTQKSGRKLAYTMTLTRSAKEER
ncbi:hypothetical protein AVDCRST_MAG92-1279 [uncultured Coleofasciculus sp.]|uniref:Uncharacterized protein n=1 Tax=uncultured Coleofasciculus sp. TaxID=1267456 RepID=A0A6J4I0J1_9CYAN|nr:hypothetical protein AVDCRST_MAG92-1279 [uncultured Coleofasciculus sp.]